MPMDSKLFTEELEGRMVEVQMRAPVRERLLRARPGTE